MMNEKQRIQGGYLSEPVLIVLSQFGCIFEDKNQRNLQSNGIHQRLEEQKSNRKMYSMSNCNRQVVNIILSVVYSSQLTDQLITERWRGCNSIYQQDVILLVHTDTVDVSSMLVKQRCLLPISNQSGLYCLSIKHQNLKI